MHEHEHEEERGKKEYIILGLRIAVSLTLALLGRFVFNEDSYPLYINLLFMIPAYLLVGYDVIWRALKGIIVEREFFDEDTLMFVASLGAFALRAFGKEHNEFLEAVLVLLLFQVGEVLEDLAADKSKEAILSAIDCKEELANVVIDGRIEKRKGEDLKVGDIVVLASGEKILCDGVVKEGAGAVDESSLSGESRLIEKEIGSPLYAGTVLSNGHLRVEVSKAYEDSTLAKLCEMIENAHNGKSRSERFIDRFSKIYTPIVVLIALFVAIIPPLFLGIGDGSVWSRWIYASLSFLVVSCPCAIVISVPLAYFSGIGLASRHGILVKGASYFDAINDLGIVAFDKTGTVTKGNLALSDIHSVGISEERFLHYLLVAESLSEHPLAKAVTAKAGKADYAYESYEEISGKGVKLRFEGEDILCGSLALLKGEGIEIEGEKPSQTAIFLAVNGKYVGFAGFADELKENSRSFVKSLQNGGISTVLLSGDHQNSVTAVAKDLGLDDYRYELLPDDKLKALEELKAKGKGKVAFMGDGVNDAPSIVSSDVGVAMGGLGSDLAIANADAVILNDDPYRFLVLRQIAKSTKNRAIFNIVFSLAIKAVIVSLGVVASIMGTWELPLWVSVLGDSGVAVLAILFSLLLHFKRIDPSPKAELAAAN